MDELNEGIIRGLRKELRRLDVENFNEFFNWKFPFFNFMTKSQNISQNFHLRLTG
jgi:hypothetical protein